MGSSRDRQGRALVFLFPERRRDGKLKQEVKRTRAWDNHLIGLNLILYIILIRLCL